MKIFNTLLTLALIFFGFAAGLTQTIERGYIKMEITDIQSDNEQMMAMSGMLKGSTTEIYFSPEKAYTKANMMGGMSQTIVLVDLKSGKNMMLMNIMGQKMKINMSEDELKEMQSGNEGDQKLNYKHFKDQTKEILGFKCHKVEVLMDAGGDSNMTLWVTDKIKTTAHVSNGIMMEDLGGFPLEYVFSMGGQLDLTMQATDFKKDFDAAIFDVKTDGYKEMTMEEFIETMGGMGGGF